MRKWVTLFLIGFMYLVPLTAAYGQSENINRSMSRDLGAFLDGGLTDGGEIQLQPTASLRPGTNPPTLGIFVNDPSTGAFEFNMQDLGPGEFVVSDPKTLDSAQLHTTIAAGDLAGATLDVTWTANTPFTYQTTQQHTGDKTMLFHSTQGGKSRFATASGTTSIVGCCTWGGAQITNNLNQTITVIKP